MAKLVQALAKASARTASAPFKQAKESVMNQADPRKAIYGLGLGVGPFIKQVVGELNKKSKDDSGAKEATKRGLLDSKAIKKSSQKSADSLSSLSKQLGSISATMKEMQATNNAQLRWLRTIAGEEAFGARQRSKLSAAPITSMSLKGEAAPADGKGFSPSSLLQDLGATGIALVAGSLIFNNREKIGAFVKDFLKSAGLPSSEDLGQMATKAMKDTVKEIGESIYESVKQSVSDLAPKVKDYVSKALGLGGNDDAGNPIPDGQPGSRGNPDKQKLGTIAGGVMGAMVPGGPVTKAAVGALGAWAGGEYPEPALAGAAAGGSMYLTWKLRQAAKVREAAQAATAVEQAAAAAAAANVKPAPAPTASPKIPAPGSLAPPGYSMSTQGILTPNSVGAGPRSAEDVRRMAEAASKQITLVDRTKVAISSIASDVSSVANNPAFQNVLKWGGRAVSALGTAVTIGQAIDDMKEGDYAAASVRLSGMMAAWGVGVFGSAFMTPVGSVAAGTTLAIGSGVAADTLKSKNRTQGASINALSNVDMMGNPLPGGDSYTPSTSTPSTTAAPRPAGGVTPTTTAAATPTAARGSYVNPVPTALDSKGDFNENRPSHTHKGIDISAKEGDPVRAIADGVVWSAGNRGDYGNMVQIKHDDGKVSLYAHLSSINVKAGDRVKAGQIIGAVGNTGSSTGPHLHLEIKDEKGNWINPRNLISGIPAYTGRPMPGMSNHTRTDVIPGSGNSPVPVNSGSSSALSQSFSNPLSSGMSREQLSRMGFQQAEITGLLDAQSSMRDLMNIGNEIADMFGMGTGSSAPAASPSSPAQQPAPGGNAPAAPPAAAASPSDFEKDRLMRLAASNARWGHMLPQ